MFFRLFAKRGKSLKALTMEKIRIFDRLYYALSELNKAFSVPVFIIIVAKFVAIITGTFACVFAYTNSKNVVTVTKAFMISESLINWIRVLTILSAAEMPTNQVSCILFQLYLDSIKFWLIVRCVPFENACSVY